MRKIVTFLLLTLGVRGQSIITTVAGTNFVFPSQPLPAVNAPLGAVAGIALDGNGNIYLTDPNNCLVMKVNSQGILSVVAGNGTPGYSGSNGPATSAALNAPHAIAIDASGNLYIADASSIRKVTAAGVITTIAGATLPGYSGDGGPAINASLSAPSAIVIDAAGDLLIADSGNHRVRKIAPGGIISTVAGTGRADFSGDGGQAANAALNAPSGLALDAAGELIIADSGNQRVRKVTTAGVISTIAGNGTVGFAGDGSAATNAELSSPSGLAIDSTGNLFISDSGNQRVRKVTSTGVISTVAGNGPKGFANDGGNAILALLDNPLGIAVDGSGKVYVADSGNERVRTVSAGIINTVVGNGAYSFGGDGGAASSAYLSHPEGLTIDANGNLLIADTGNNRIRKWTPAGLISTIAGNGTGGPALAGELNGPSSLATDSRGSVYIADTQNGAVEKIVGGPVPVVASQANFAPCNVVDPTDVIGFTPTGVAVDSSGNIFISDVSVSRILEVSGGKIKAIAGNPNGCFPSGFAGDGGPALSAALNNPSGIAVDSSGNVYFSDSGNNRVRKISGGNIATFAGSGGYGYTGDNAPAANAGLANPQGLWMDGKGNLYIADTGNHRVRMVNPAGIITTVAGNGLATFSGDGGTPVLASLNSPQGVAVDKLGNIFISDTGNNRIREIPVAPPTYALTPNTLAFSAIAGSVSPPSQTINLTTSLPGLGFMATTSDSWITATPAVAALPAAVQVSVNANLAPGSYSGTVTFSAAGANPPTMTVQVSFKVAVPVPAKLGVSNPAVSFTTPQSSNALTSQMTVSNLGDGSIRFTATPASAGNWLHVTPAGGSVTATSPVSLTITASPGSLAVGTYSGTITLASPDTGDNFAVPVTLAVSQAVPKILLSQGGLTFTAVEQGGTPLPQSFGILNTGTGSMNWTAQVNSLSGGNWLSIDQTSGAVATPYTSVSLINASLNPAGLTAAQSPYYAQIKITAPGGINSPQSVTVVLNVLPVGTNPGAEVRPTGLIFIGSPGNSPGSQSVTVSNPASNPSTFGGQFFTVPTGGNWVQFLPANATIAPNAPTSVTVQPNFTALGSGIFQGFLTFGFLDGNSRTVNMLAVVPPQGSTSSSAQLVREDVNPKCSPLSVVPTALTDPNSTVKLSQPATLSVRVVDSCGNTMTGGSVSAVFSNGDPQVSLTHVGSGASNAAPQGTWTGTWTPQNGKQSPVTVQFLAINVQGTSAVQGQGQITVGLQPQTSTPLAVFAANAASGVGTYVAPGGLVSIYGTLLSDQSGQPNTAPFPKTFNGTQVLVGGVSLPLRYVSATQLNAQVPFEIAANTDLQLTIQRDNTISVPLSVVVAPAQPAIYTQDSSGSGPGVIIDATQGYQVVTVQAPAAAGDVLVIYCNGLGAVNPPVPTGNLAPSVEPLARTENPVTVTIGGVAASVSFAGLAPGFPDLYQVNVTIPSGVGSGNAVPVVLTIAGQSSPPATVSIR
jgi:uncharacterized protein (TIGR03437 family)